MEEINPINPLGSCFESAFELLFSHSFETLSPRLAHCIGIARGLADEGERITHAVIRFRFIDRDYVLDPISGNVGTWSDFATHFQLEKHVEYSRQQVVKLYTLTGVCLWSAEILEATFKATSPELMAKWRQLLELIPQD